jgi:hypothetical protein
LPPILLDKLSNADLRQGLGRVVGLKDTSKKRLCADIKVALNAAYSEDRRQLPSDLKFIISVPERREGARRAIAASRSVPT